jgi:hypothetical protein
VKIGAVAAILLMQGDSFRCLLNTKAIKPTGMCVERNLSNWTSANKKTGGVLSNVLQTHIIIILLFRLLLFSNNNLRNAWSSMDRRQMAEEL